MIWKRDLLLVVVFLMLFPVQASAQTAFSSNTSVNPLALAQVTDFSVTPAFTSQNQLIDFSVTVENTGNIQINATAFINITDSANNTVSNITFTPVGIAVGNDAAFIASWNTNSYPLGDYRGVALVYYDNKSTSPSVVNFRIQAVTPPPTGGGGPGPSPPPEELLPGLPQLTPPVEQPLGESRIRFVKYPVIEEIRPGETATADILFSNTGDMDIMPLEIRVEGVPPEWVEVKTEDVELKAGETNGINMGFSVPAGAFPGDYRVTAALKSGDNEARTFFILRVKPYPVELERPSVTRRVVVDAEEGTSTVSLKVENAGRFIKRLEIVEDIPKEIASHVNQVDFGVPPSEVIEADPVIRWALGDIDFYETRTIDYEVPQALDEYTPYVNWPLKQLNIFYDITPPKEDMEISKVETSTLSPGKAGTLSATVSNNGVTPVNMTLVIELPTGWGVEPEEVTQVFAPTSKDVFNFTITPPEETTLGVYGATLKVNYNGKSIAKDVSLFVREPPAESPLMLWLLWILLIALIVLIIYYGRRIYKRSRKKVVYREDIVSTVHRLQDEMFKEE